jgi:cystathionine beta-lyase
MDLVHAPRRHIPLATLGSERVVTLTSASKSFNLAGLHYAVSHVGAPAVAAALKSLPERVVGEPGMLGVIAAHAAWTGGASWLDAIRDHLVEMRANVAHLVESNLPGITMTPPDATYLAWLDCRATSIADDPSRAFARVGVAVNSGNDFGPGGAGFVRLNFATTRDVLERTIHAMAEAVAT